MLKVEQAGPEWVVRNESGEVLQRGPEWACWLYVAEAEQDERRREVNK